MEEGAPVGGPPYTWCIIYSHRVIANQTRDMHSWCENSEHHAGEIIKSCTNLDSLSVLESSLFSYLETGMSLVSDYNLGEGPDGATGGPQEQERKMGARI